jgi:hypothetical protein
VRCRAKTNAFLPLCALRRQAAPRIAPSIEVFEGGVDRGIIERTQVHGGRPCRSLDLAPGLVGAGNRQSCQALLQVASKAVDIHDHRRVAIVGGWLRHGADPDDASARSSLGGSTDPESRAAVRDEHLEDVLIAETSLIMPIIGVHRIKLFRARRPVWRLTRASAAAAALSRPDRSLYAKPRSHRQSSRSALSGSCTCWLSLSETHVPLISMAGELGKGARIQMLVSLRSAQRRGRNSPLGASQNGFESP